ncbi:MAG: cytochrome c [Notoacmeibacter sp.]|nr:cytochrome c [Notoacmeibacter sp.]MCC0033382.1 cytochrome c [Brucellaceae bacterium]
MTRTSLAALALASLSLLSPQQAGAADGKALFEEHCATCHMPAEGASHDDLVAPPIFGVAMKYAQAHGDEAATAQAIKDWIMKPEEGRSVMPQWVARFGLMPPLELSEDDASAIAAYVATAEFSQPNGPGMGHGPGMDHGSGMDHGPGMGKGPGRTE